MEDDDLIPISALQHYLYCPRQFALIQVERLWSENRHTAEGRIMHDRADLPGIEQRRGVRTVTAMPLAAPALGVAGVADVVEFRVVGSTSVPCPVEYKRGRPKAHRADEVQLCAQGLCLEAMLGCAVPEGALFYGQTRRRKLVAFDGSLRELTLQTILAVRALFQERSTPSATYEPKRCDACSLMDLCRPREIERRQSVRKWLERQMEATD
ncbi:CRISPR-associated protein Cas4 [Sinimarinibacterium flocculans]|uniref:CRISPR-associated exonuclease Cas4 n=1 Tax=Sinimarinibacterium flocculans TaxID=985250 RepID=A0A318EHA7_9GAMM|nr:CRISPR-associated protein Cas4 [Sinimarinibacterium flocculans]PXV67836.1 CRISPR-associated Cas4 family exonuclease [Sinimarinibacterium flocculans]HBG31912.1 CRISPR-associated protein Cas4 [Gammaproteobacteria bacterium]